MKCQLCVRVADNRDTDISGINDSCHHPAERSSLALSTQWRMYPVEDTSNAPDIILRLPDSVGTLRIGRFPRCVPAINTDPAHHAMAARPANHTFVAARDLSRRQTEFRAHSPISIRSGSFVHYHLNIFVSFHYHHLQS